MTWGRKPDNLGVKDGRLAPCPAAPNCVSSQAADARLIGWTRSRMSATPTPR